MKLMDIVVKEAVIPELSATKRDGIIAELVDALVAAGCAVSYTHLTLPTIYSV